MDREAARVCVRGEEGAGGGGTESWSRVEDSQQLEVLRPVNQRVEDRGREKWREVISKHGFTTSFLDLPPTAAINGYAIRLPNCQPTDNLSLVLKYCQSVDNRNSSFLKCFYCNRPHYLLQHK